MVGVEISDLSISFPLYHGDARTFRKGAGNGVSGRFGRDGRRRVVVEALKNINFSLKPGDRLGLIGHNGAGKTTLLRAMAGIYEPVKGRVRVHGRIGTLLDTSLGMNPELSGRENIRIRCQLYGLSKQETSDVEEDVEEFADLGPFMDLPMKSFSSGMSMRIAFGLATAIMPQVLLMDEWIMTGDAWFLGRAKKRLAGLVEQSDILVLSSHNEVILSEWCTRLIWMDQGQVIMDGSTDEVLTAYQQRSASKETPSEN
ncbi:MAG: ABC transporter ATP-binding protein [Acetobacter sp.]|jgi:lipopolysaccharide transport system ATP-binding protein